MVDPLKPAFPKVPRQLFNNLSQAPAGVDLNELSHGVESLTTVSQVICIISQGLVVTNVRSGDYLVYPCLGDVMLITKAVLEQFSGQHIALTWRLDCTALDEPFGWTGTILL